MEHISITPKQLEILLLLYRFRFLSRIHIQTLMHYKDYRRINAWLKALTDLEYIGITYSRKQVGIYLPAIYFLQSNARSALKSQKGVQARLLNRIYREKSRSKVFIDHSLFLATVYVRLNTQAEENKEILHFYTKTDLEKFSYLPLPTPDAYIAIEKDKSTKRYFLEVIDDGIPRFAIRKKIERYFTYFDTNLWQKYHKCVFPKVLIICPTESLKKYLHIFIGQVLEEETAEIEFYLSTKEHSIKWEKVELE